MSKTGACHQAVGKGVCAGLCVVCVSVRACVCPDFQSFDLPASLYQLKLLRALDIAMGGNGKQRTEAGTRTAHSETP